MATLPSTFNVADVPADEYDLIKPDVYEAMIVDNEVRTTRAGDGTVYALKVQLKNGRVIYENLNLQNPSAKAMEIAAQTLAKICKACGKTSIRDLDELHNIRISVSVGVEKGQDGIDRNKIKKYMPLTSQQDTEKNPSAPTSPWKR